MSGQVECPYKANGYADRRGYLNGLAEDMDLPQDMVDMFADILGPNEDFDGLVTLLEDNHL